MCLRHLDDVATYRDGEGATTRRGMASIRFEHECHTGSGLEDIRVAYCVYQTNSLMDKNC
jgi:hypothetical protein